MQRSSAYVSLGERLPSIARALPMAIAFLRGPGLIFVRLFLFFRDLGPKHEKGEAFLLEKYLLIQGGQALAPFRFDPELGSAFCDFGQPVSARCRVVEHGVVGHW